MNQLVDLYEGGRGGRTDTLPLDRLRGTLRAWVGCGFRGKTISIPNWCRSRFRADADRSFRSHADQKAAVFGMGVCISTTCRWSRCVTIPSKSGPAQVSVASTSTTTAAPPSESCRSGSKPAVDSAPAIAVGVTHSKLTFHRGRLALPGSREQPCVRWARHQ